MTDGRITVPALAGSPRWRGIRELRAELWRLLLAGFSFSYLQFLTLGSHEFWNLESPDVYTFIYLFAFFLKEQICSFSKATLLLGILS